jgi:site-specific recombinase XerC
MRHAIAGQLELDFSGSKGDVDSVSAPNLTTGDDGGMIGSLVRDKRYRLTALGKAVADYLSWKDVEDGAAARTLDQYERDLSRLCLGHPCADVDELTADEYRSVIAAFPPRSRKRTTAVFRDFSRWLYQEGRAEHDVMGRVRYPRMKRQSAIDIFSEAECVRLLQQPDRDRPLVRLLLEAGLRKGPRTRDPRRHRA